MWVTNDYTIINYVLVGDHIKWNSQIIKVTDIDDSGDMVKVFGVDEWDEDVELLIPDCETVPLMVWD